MASTREEKISKAWLEGSKGGSRARTQLADRGVYEAFTGSTRCRTGSGPCTESKPGTDEPHKFLQKLSDEGVASSAFQAH